MKDGEKRSCNYPGMCRDEVDQKLKKKICAIFGLSLPCHNILCKIMFV